jgi:concentrative nucleoside transporter, CNT family
LIFLFQIETGLILYYLYRSVFIAYVSLGIDGRNLLLSAFMSIPGSIAASKLVVPETQRPKTLGKVVIVQSDDETKSVDILHALSNGAWFGLRVAGLIFCNVLVIVSVVYTVNGM